MIDREEMMSLFEEFENSLDIEEKNFSVSTPRKKENTKKQSDKITVTKPKTSKKTITPKKTITHKETIAEKYEKAAEQANQKKIKAELKKLQKEKKAEEKYFHRRLKNTDKAVRKMAKKEAKQPRKQTKRITEPKKRSIFNRLGNIINLNEHEYDIYKQDIKDYKKGKLSEEHIKLEWEEIQDYEDAKSDITLRAAWGTFKLALVGLGLFVAVNFGGQILKSTYDLGQGLTEGFWDDTKRNMEENEKQYELFHGEYLPNGEKKRRLTAEEYEQLTPEQRKYISYIPSIDAELEEDEAGNITVILPDNTNKVTADTTQKDDTKDLER